MLAVLGDLGSLQTRGQALTHAEGTPPRHRKKCADGKWGENPAVIAQSKSIHTGDKAGDVFSTGEKNLCNSDSREAKGVSRQVCRHWQGSGLGLCAIHTLQCACESPGSLKHELVREEETRKR